MNRILMNGRMVGMLLGAATTVALLFLLWKGVQNMSKPLEPWTGPLPLFDTQTKQLGSSAEEHPDMKYWRQHRWVDKLPKAGDIPHKHLSYLYHSYLDNINYFCHNKLRMGKVGDGGWEVCDDPEYRPVKPCIVYSFGIANDFSFDDEVNRLYGCDVFAFDPSMKVDNHQRSAGVYFYNVGLRGEAGNLPPNAVDFVRKEGWRMETLTDIKAMLKHADKIIDIMKIDIEHSEWTSLEHMLAKGELARVRQLYVEYHVRQNWVDLPQMYSVLKQIEDLGFQRFYSHVNPACWIVSDEYPIKRSTCYEVYYVNTALARSQQQH